MNQQTFANYTGIGSASLSSIFTGRTRPTLNHVDAILEKFPTVNPLWLLKGIGGMMLTQEDGDGATATASPNGSNTPADGGRNSSATLSVQPSLFEGQPQRHPQDNNASGAPRQQRPSFHFEAEQKPITITRKITEIRVFYDDQTWESFVPKKEK